MNETKNMTEQNRQGKVKCEYCGGRINLDERLRIQACEFKKRADNSGNINPKIVFTKNYHRKCYIEKYKDYKRLKGEEE